MPATTFWLLLFGTCFGVQAVYWLVLWMGFRRAQQAVVMRPDVSLPPVSVVVAARNEAARLPALLDALLHQTHPRFEIVVVDDASTDDTAAIVRARQQAHAGLRLVSITNPQPPRKKHALTRGIDAARYDLLAFTDADCTPPPDWLTELARHHAAVARDVLLIGYSPFRKAPGLLNRLARYETFITGFLTAAAIGWDRPYMAVGRNLSYSRALFHRIDGFSHSLHRMSGDDDLLVQEVARHRAAEVHALLDPRTFVPTDAPATWHAWLRQKLRHLSASRSYDRAVQVHLALFQAAGIALWIAPLLLGWAGVALLAARLSVQGFVLYHAAQALYEHDLMPALPLLDACYACYHLLIAPLGIIRTPKRW